jgi:methionyl aminopeptidase
MNQKKLEIMTAGGRHLHDIKSKIIPLIKVGTSLIEIDTKIDNLITKAGDYPSFKTVRNYHHASCINLNAGIVHGIPDNTKIKPGDLVSIDLGLIHQDYHLDSAFTIKVPPLDQKTNDFLETGKKALKEAISKALPGNSIYQISDAIQTTVETKGYSAIRELTGHGVGKKLHESPSIPCFRDNYYKKEIIKPGQALAIEVMYALGDYHLKTATDGWTIETKDGSLTALFEETVFITPDSNLVLT